MSRFLMPGMTPRPASVARERLESLLEHDRNLVGHRDLVSVLREEIRAVIRRHADIDTVHFAVVRSPTSATLQVDIEVPAPTTVAPYCL